MHDQVCTATCDRDIFALHLTRSDEHEGAACLCTDDSQDAASYVCPITGLSCLRYAFVAISKCGHALSDRAMKEVMLKLQHICIMSVTLP